MGRLQIEAFEKCMQSMHGTAISMHINILIKKRNKNAITLMLQFRCKLSAWNERAYAHKLTLSTGIVLFTLKNAKSIGVLFCIPIAPLLI